MEKARVLIADKDAVALRNLNDVLVQHGYLVVGEAKDGLDTLKQAHEKRPEIVILEYDMPIIDGLEVAKTLEEKKLSAVLLLSSRKDKEIIEKSKEAWVMGYLIKPFDSTTLDLTIEMAIANFNKIIALEKELEKLKGSLKSRKKIEKAKGILMKDLNISEPEAFRRLQKMSMDKRTSMEKIADAIILTQD